MEMLVNGLFGVVILILFLNWLNALINPSRVPWLSGKQHNRKTAVWRGLALIAGVSVACAMINPWLQIFSETENTSNTYAAQQSTRQTSPAQPQGQSETERKKDAAFLECRKLLPSQVKHPSSLDVHIMQVSFSVRENGQIFVNMPFSAKNDFGSTVEMTAVCHIWEGHSTRISISNL